MLSTVRTYASFVKFSHTVFALPFALTGMLAAYMVPGAVLLPGVRDDGKLSFQNPHFTVAMLFLVLCSMVGARSFAMAANRILDRKIDAINPRTALRELPSGRISVRQAVCFAITTAILYFTACLLLGDVVLALSPIPIALMAIYPFTKRFTSLCHLVLGASLGLAPIGAWVAVRSVCSESWTADLFSPEWRVHVFGGGYPLPEMCWEAVVEPAPWILGAAVMFWVAGFDVVYALQDDEFDRSHGLHSIPATLGRTRALWISRLMHIASAILFFGFIAALHLDYWYAYGTELRYYVRLAPWVWAAPCVMLVGMIYQHSLVKPNDLSRVNLAFFTVNGVISIFFGAIFLAARLLA